MNLWFYEVCTDVAYFFINVYKRVTSPNVRIGRGAKVNIHAKLEGYNKIERNSLFVGEMGRYSYIGVNCRINGLIGRFCSIGGNVVFLSSTHPVRDFISTHPVFYSKKKQSGKSFTSKNLFNEYPKKEGHRYSIEIGNDVYIGYGVTVIGPVSIGNGAVIGACSVVTKDVPPYAIVVGNPAKILKYRFNANEIELLERVQWWNKDEDWLAEHAEQFTSFESFEKCFS